MKHSEEYIERLIINEILKFVMCTLVGLVLGMLIGLMLVFPAFLVRVVLVLPKMIWDLL